MKLGKWLITIAMLACSAVAWSKVNINTATLAELETLKGIGVKKAENIIAYRKEVGEFKSVDDLIQVTGIGAATLDKIRNEIEVGNSNSKTNTQKAVEKAKESTNNKLEKHQEKVTNHEKKIEKSVDKSSKVEKDDKVSSKSSTKEDKHNNSSEAKK